MTDYVQDSRHDWFADVAEAFVSYLLASAGFEVYAGSKWGADIAAREYQSSRWFRVEVRSSDCNHNPLKKGAAKLAGVDAVADVTFPEGKLRVDMIRLGPNGYRDGECRMVVDSPMRLHEWILKQILRL